ncbi:MAG: extracellular solute-binding protein [Clostridiales bacterium]|nr:extracellular solute-binding protein [Clostridiales bacterium]
MMKERKCNILHKGSFAIGTKLVAVAITLVILMSSITGITAFAASGDKLTDKFTNDYSDQNFVYDRDDVNENRYSAYLEENSKKGAKDYAGADIVLLPGNAISRTEAAGSTKDNPIYKDVPLVSGFSGKTGTVLAWGSEYTAFEWVVDIAKGGFYEITIEYMCADGIGISAAREISINGEVPFSEAVRLDFKRWWVDQSAPKENAVGDQVAPSQKEIRKWSEAVLRDNNGYYATPYKFYLKTGSNTIRLNFADQPMYIAKITLSAPTTYISYEEYSQQYENVEMSATVASGIADKFEAEDILRIVAKSTSGLRLASSTDATVSPRTLESVYMNSIGGEDTWFNERNSIEWKFNVEEDGLYQISARVYQGYTFGMPSYRQIYIDGEIPFEELVAYKIPYASSYTTMTLSSEEGTPYLFYLEKGEHTITMEVVAGDYGQILMDLYDESVVLGNLLREIYKITSENPDVNYNYYLATRIPHLIPSLKALVESFEEKIATLQKASGEADPAAANNFRTIIEDLQACIDDPFDIPKKLGSLDSALTSMGTWITELATIPLQVDTITIAGKDAVIENPKQTFWQSMEYMWKSFIVSFKKDYSSVSETEDEGKTVLDLWVARGREEAQLLKELLDEAFADTDIAVRMTIVPAGQVDMGQINLVLLALLAGNEPDMTFGCNGTTPVNFAIREAAYNLENFEDFEEVRSRFLDGVMVPFEYTDDNISGTFGLPEKMDFGIMFYRKDILSSLGLAIPQTWEEVYDETIPVLYRENYKMCPTSYDIMLYQRDGYYYRSDFKLSGLDVPDAYDAFVEYTELYTCYSMDVQYEAFDRFRRGTMPFIFGNMDMYIKLVAAAPELTGKWGIAPMPGHLDEENGVINRAQAALLGSSVMIMNSTEHPEACWEILKWWTSAETQTEYGYAVEGYFGSKTRWSSANVDAFMSLPWTAEEKAVLQTVLDWLVQVPVVLGDYQTTRFVTFAFNQVVVQGLNTRDALEDAVESINKELKRKQKEYNITPADEEDLLNPEFDIRPSDYLPKYKDIINQNKNAQGGKS